MLARQTLHRERDPRARRSMATALAVAALLVGATLGVVGVKMHQVRLAREYVPGGTGTASAQIAETWPLAGAGAR